jgi:hypothetical protein
VVVATYARGLTACGNLVGVSSANSSANSSADQTSKKQVSSACKIALGFPCLLGSDYTGVAPAARVWWTGATASLRTSPPTWGSAGCRQLLGVQKEDAVSTRCLPPQVCVGVGVGVGVVVGVSVGEGEGVGEDVGVGVGVGVCLGVGM